MILSTVPRPDVSPPFVQVTADGEGGQLSNVRVFRDGRLIRWQPPSLGGTVSTLDYEAPFGRPVSYRVTADVAGGWSTLVDVDWASLDGWETVLGSPVISGGRLSSADGELAGVRRIEPLVLPSMWRVVIPYGSMVPNDGPAWLSSVIGVGDAVVTPHQTEPDTFQVSFREGPMVGLVWTSGDLVVTVQNGGESALSIVASANGVEKSVPIGASRKSPTIEAGGSGTGSVGAFRVETVTQGSIIEQSETVTTTLEVPDAWAIHPSLPERSVMIQRGAVDWDEHQVNLTAEADSTRSFASTRSVFAPVGGRRSVAYPTGGRREGAWELTLQTHEPETLASIKLLLDDDAPILLRFPPSMDELGLPDGWFSVGDVDVARMMLGLHHPHRTFSLPLEPVDEPIVNVRPLWTWANVMAEYATWNDVMADFDTWEDLRIGPLE